MPKEIPSPTPEGQQPKEGITLLSPEAVQIPFLDTLAYQLANEPIDFGAAVLRARPFIVNRSLTFPQMASIVFERHIQAMARETSKGFAEVQVDIPDATAPAGTYQMRWNKNKRVFDVLRMKGKHTETETDYDFLAFVKQNDRTIAIVLDAKLSSPDQVRKSKKKGSYQDSVQETEITRKLTPLREIFGITDFVYGLVGTQELPRPKWFMEDYKQRGGRVLWTIESYDQILSGIKTAAISQFIPIPIDPKQ